MASLSLGVKEQVSQLGIYLMEVDMFPVFLVAHFILAVLLVREDCRDLGPKFRQNHPLTSWLCTVVTGLSGVFVANFLFGEPLVNAVKENVLIVILSVIWYLINYSPYDVVYKIVTFKPISLSCSVLQEGLRARFIYLGILQAAHSYPGSFLIILLGGVIKGNGYGLIKIVERLIRGKWTPATNEFLDVTYFSKSGIYASLLFLLHHNKQLNIPIELLYLGVLTTFVTFRLLIIVGGVKDPLLPLESPVCALLFGSDSQVVEETVNKKQN
uniref:Uncharacterized protein n=1 Tax=Arion vulgaris TaxID=1028688 RepID=A0A0B6ZFU2_9EUPU